MGSRQKLLSHKVYKKQIKHARVMLNLMTMITKATERFVFKGNALFISETTSVMLPKLECIDGNLE